MVDPLAGRIRCRAKDSFNPIFITRKGAQFVFARRLLKKTGKQLARIRAYLAPFAKFYAHLNKRTGAFACFPVHSDGINPFERIRAPKEREIIGGVQLAKGFWCELARGQWRKVAEDRILLAIHHFPVQALIIRLPASTVLEKAARFCFGIKVSIPKRRQNATRKHRTFP